MRQSLWVIILALATLSTTVNAEVYKWKDKDGTVRYSDVPPSGTTQYEPLKAKKPANGSVAAPVTSEAKTSDKSVKTTDASGGTEGQAKIKEKACANAKENLQKLKQGGIVYKENAKGEREYLDETSMKAETAAAQKEVDISCK